MTTRRKHRQTSSCCGAELVRVAGILRCERCEREVLTDPAPERPLPTHERHRLAYERGEEE